MEAFKVFMLRFSRRKTKVLLCLKNKKQNEVKNLCRFCKEKEKNEMKDGMKNGDV